MRGAKYIGDRRVILREVPKQAVETLERALAVDPQHVNALLLASVAGIMLYRSSGEQADLQKAIDYAQRAGDADPGFWKGPFALGVVYQLSGETSRVRSSPKPSGRGLKYRSSGCLVSSKLV